METGNPLIIRLKEIGTLESESQRQGAASATPLVSFIILCRGGACPARRQPKHDRIIGAPRLRHFSATCSAVPQVLGYQPGFSR
jgi:hypothetical protein